LAARRRPAGRLALKAFSTQGLASILKVADNSINDPLLATMYHSQQGVHGARSKMALSKPAARLAKHA